MRSQTTRLTHRTAKKMAPKTPKSPSLTSQQRGEDVVVVDGGEPEAVGVDAGQRPQRDQQDDQDDDDAEHPPPGPPAPARRRVSSQVAGDTHGGSLTSAPRPQRQGRGGATENSCSVPRGRDQAAAARVRRRVGVAGGEHLGRRPPLRPGRCPRSPSSRRPRSPPSAPCRPPVRRRGRHAGRERLRRARRRPAAPPARPAIRGTPRRPARPGLARSRPRCAGAASPPRPGPVPAAAWSTAGPVGMPAASAPAKIAPAANASPSWSCTASAKSARWASSGPSRDSASMLGVLRSRSSRRFWSSPSVRFTVRFSFAAIGVSSSSRRR